VSRILAFAVCWLSLATKGQSQTPQSPTAGDLSRPLHLLASVLADYSRLTGKTVLRSSTLPTQLGRFSAELPSETNAAAAFLESQLRENGILLIQDALLFVRAVPVGWTNSTAAAFLARVKPPADDPEKHVGAASLGAADLEQVLRIYSKVRNRTLLRPRSVASSLLYLNTTRAMTNEQLGYGLTVLLALNGIAAVDDGEHFVQLVPVDRWRDVVTQSPKPLPGIPVLDPAQVPPVKPDAPPVALNHLNRLFVQVFHQPPPWTPRPVDKLVEFYAGLSDLKAVSSESYGKLPVWFEVTTPLTKEELHYAIEATLRLEGLAITKVGDGNKVGVISLVEQRRLEKEKSAGPTRR